MPDNAFPLAPIVSSLLSDDHLLNLLFSCLVLKNKSSSLCLLVFGAGDLAFRAQERSQYEFEAIAIVCPAGTKPPKGLDLTAAMPNTSVYTSVTDLDDLKLGHELGISMIPQILTCGTAAPHGIEALVHHIMDVVIAPDGGVCLIGALAPVGPMHHFLSENVAKKTYFGSKKLREVLEAEKSQGIVIEDVIRHQLTLTAATADEFKMLMNAFLCLAESDTHSAYPCISNIHRIALRDGRVDAVAALLQRCRTLNSPTPAHAYHRGLSGRGRNGGGGGRNGHRYEMHIHVDYYIFTKNTGPPCHSPPPPQLAVGNINYR